MIFDSRPWKKELSKLSQIIYRARFKTKLSESRDIAYEKAIFISAYIVRKLFETSKLSYKLKEISCPIKKYPNIKHVNLFNWHNIDQVFDLNNPAKHSLNIKKLCNYLIHSFIFILSYNERNSLNGFFFTSDKEKNNSLYFIQIKDFINILQKIVEDEKIHSRYIKDKNGDLEEIDPNLKNKFI